MPQTKQSANELPVAGKNTAEAEPDMDAKKSVAQILLEKKAAAEKNRYQPPSPRTNYKGKKIGAAPRGTRKSMGKR